MLKSFGLGLLLLLPLCTFAQTPADTLRDFRKTRWGMSRAEVLALEPGTPVADADSALVYESDLAGLACRVTYVFADSQLTEAAYLITEPHDRKNAYLTDFKSLKQVLTEKYGKPAVNKTKWANPYYKDNPQYWGVAVSMGHMRQWARWEAPRTAVELRLEGGDFNLELGIRYESRAHANARRKAGRDKLMGEF